MSDLSGSLNNSHSQLIKSVFSDLECQPNSKFSYEDLATYLSKKSGKPFSNELLLEIFRSVDLTQSSTISVNDFISGYQRTEFMLSSQISALKQQITENITSLSKAQKSLLESKSQKFQNKAENNLYLTIKDVQDLGELQVNGKWVVKVVCEGHEVLTDPKDKNDLAWDQSFTFPVSSGQGSIHIQVWTWDSGALKKCYFELAIPFYALAKQDLHEDTLAMKPTQPSDTELHISLSIQWIYDLVVYLESMIKQYEDAIKEDKNQLEILKTFLTELKNPTETFALPAWVKNNEDFSKVEKIVSVTVQEVFEKVEFFQSNSADGGVRWGKVLNLTLLTFFLFTVFNCFFRPDFFNVLSSQVTLLVYAIAHFVKTENLATHFRIVAAGLVLTQFSDVIWAFHYVSFM